MPSSTQGTITQANGGEYGTGSRSKGSSDTADLLAAYPGSPLAENMTAVDNETNVSSSTLKEWYQANVLDGTQNGNTLTGTVDMDYGTTSGTATDLQAPDLARAAPVDIDGNPINSYVPDVSAEAATSVYPNSDRIAPIPTSPSTASKTMSGQNISALPIKGKSEVPTVEPTT